MNFTETAFFADFGVNATLNGASVRGIFDNQAAEAFGLVSGSNPVFLTPSAANALQGQTLIIGAATYIVASVESDGTGLDRLQLEKQ